MKPHDTRADYFDSENLAMFPTVDSEVFRFLLHQT